jgi:hypothetical protein
MIILEAEMELLKMDYWHITAQQVIFEHYGILVNRVEFQLSCTSQDEELPGSVIRSVCVSYYV